MSAIKIPVNTATALERFGEIIASAEMPADATPEAVLAQARRIVGATPPKSAATNISAYVRARRAAVTQLLRDYTAASLAKRYTPIDPALFKLQRHIRLDRAGSVLSDQTTSKSDSRSRVAISIRLFQWAYMGDSGGKFYVAVTGTRWANSASNDNDRYDGVVIRATVPTIPDSIIEAGKQAIGHCYQAIGEAFAEPAFHEGNLNTLLEAGSLTDHAAPPTAAIGPDAVVAWIPTPKSLQCRLVKSKPKPPAVEQRYDPAMLLVFGGKLYLVKTWIDDKVELPFDSYLREFSSGKYRG